MIFTVGAALEIPTRFPVDVEMEVTVFPEAVVVACKPEPSVIPVKAAPQLTGPMVLLLMTVPFEPSFTVMGFIDPVGVVPVLNVNVFPEIVFTGALPEEPSVLSIPTKLVAPVKEILEKLLFCIETVLPVTELAFVVKNVTVFPATLFVKPVVNELPSMVIVPVAGKLFPFMMNVKLPDVFVVKLLKILLLMLELRKTEVIEIAVIPVVAVAEVWFRSVNSLLFIFIVEVEVPLVVPEIIP